MVTDGANVVAGLFSSRTRADAALKGLQRIGLTDADVEVGAPEPGRYRIEFHESRELGRGVLIGVVIGIPVGSLIAVGILKLAVPGMSMVAALGLGILIGGFWGLFFGGLGGMVAKVLAHAKGTPRCAISAGSSEVVVIAHAGDRISAAHEVMQSQKPRFFLTDVPTVRSPLAMTS